MMRRVIAALAAVVGGVVVATAAQAGPSAIGTSTVELSWTTSYTNGTAGAPALTFTPGLVPVFEYGTTTYKPNMSLSVNLWRDPGAFEWATDESSADGLVRLHKGLTDGFSHVKADVVRKTSSFLATATAFAASSMGDYANQPSSQAVLLQRVTLPAYSRVTFTLRGGYSGSVDGMLSPLAGPNPSAYTYGLGTLNIYTLGTDGKFRAGTAQNVIVMTDPVSTGQLVDVAYDSSTAAMSRTVTNNTATPLTFAVAAQSYAFAMMNHDAVAAGTAAEMSTSQTGGDKQAAKTEVVKRMDAVKRLGAAMKRASGAETQ